MKSLRYIGLLFVLLLSQWMVAGTKLESADKNWLGGLVTFNTTEGTDFWLTFMNSSMFDPTHPDNKKIKFELKIAVSASEAMKVHVAVGGTDVTTLNLAAGETQIYEFNRDQYAKDIYLLTSEKTGYKGVHVYADKEDKDKLFSCFSYYRHGDPAGSFRDAALILPTRFLGREYFIQTNSEDFYSSEFAIVATENGTTVTITPTEETFNGKPAGTPFTVSLSKGQAYLVSSRQHKDDDPDYKVDLSGTTICSNKPVAVFNGNQETSVPVNSVLKRDFSTEQTIPISQWGKHFYLTQMAQTKEHYFRLTAIHETKINIVTEGSSSTITLPAGASSDVYYINNKKKEYIITSEEPIICFSYTPSLHKNPQEIGDIEFNLGNTSNAMMPSWSHRAKMMNFFTHEMDPEKVEGTDSPQEYYVYLVTKTSETDLIEIDGQKHTAEFNKFIKDPSMSYAHIEVGNNSPYHTVETTGEGFVGMVYALSQAQGYHYTLGYYPHPYQDSLFITNDEALMSPTSYDLERLDGHGWYQRQWNEWMEGKERLDTAVVCDSSTVFWALESPEERPIKQIDWNLYDVTEGRKKISDGTFPKQDFPAETDVKHELSYKFILPKEEPEDRHQFFDYELEIILHRDQIICGDEDLDTFRTVTRVTRIFNDTMWYALCMGDTLEFFYDSLYTQADLTKFKPGKKDSTLFIATKSGEVSTKEWEWNVGLGAHEFQRKYVSQFGCDSIVTLELFVCDTFRYVDTIHLCSNQDTLYHDHLFYGMDFMGSLRPYPKTMISKDTTTHFVKFKTEFCGCQTGEEADKYLDKDKKKFMGCDSIYELHVFLHLSYDLHTTDTLDYKEYPDSIYHWQIERGGVTRDSLISLKDTLTGKLVWNDYYQAWRGRFGDTLRTKTCSECNGGNPKGCDSINSLTLYVPKVYHFEENVVWCRIHYDWSKHDTTYQDFQWIGHHHDTLLTKGGDYYDSCVSRYGADSIYHLHLVYSEAVKPVYDLVKETVCLDTINRRRNWTSSDGVINVDTIRQDIVGHFYYVDESRCDSIYALDLTVLPTYFYKQEKLISQEGKFKWDVNGKTYAGPLATGADIDSVVYEAQSIIDYYDQTKPVNGVSCDSIWQLTLWMGDVYRDTVQAYACGEDNIYVWIEDRPQYMPDGVPFIRKTITDLPAENTSRIYTDPYRTTLGFDSIFYLDLYRAPAYYKDTNVVLCQDTNNLYTWGDGHETHMVFDKQKNVKLAANTISLREAGDFYYVDSLETEVFGCDSVWTLHLHIDPIFFRDTVDTVCQFSEYMWLNNDQDSIVDATGKKIATIPTDHIGDHKYDIMFHTIYGCDSIWHLTLHVDTVYVVPVSITDTFMCDKDSIVFIDHVVYGSESPNKPEGEPGIKVPDGQEFITVPLTGKVPSSLGCDSAVEYSLTVFKTYYKEETDRVCQPSEGRDSLYRWVGHDTVWDVHNNRFIPADSIPRYVKGDTTYTYIDSLRTSFCTLCNHGRGGCDSIFILYLTIDSSYHFYDTAHICENERYTEWQEWSIAGDSVADIDVTKDTVRAPGAYDFRVAHTGVNTCDSIYYLHLVVHPVYHTRLRYTFCDNDTARASHFFEFKDTHGYYQLENVEYTPHAPVPEEDSASTYYEIIYKQLEHHMKTVDGCDSIVTVDITIKPTYEFRHRVSICHSGIYEWRGKEYMVQGHYEDKYHTADGSCDSIFTLDLFIKPVHITIIYDTICDNETYWFRDTIFYVDAMGHEQMIINEEPIWSPGDPRPRPYIETVVKSMPPDICDSLIYRYYLTICNTYFREASGTLCSGKPFEYTFDDGLTHVWETTTFEYDTDEYILPFDSVFIDSLQTVMGCDSVFKLNAHVLPSYRHVVYDTICENETYDFRTFTIVPEATGDTIIRDSLQTVVDACDSIYELRLHVWPKYYEETYDTICANESYEWQGMILEHIEPTGDTLFINHLYSVHGCDSIFHLYLHVLDTTFEVRYDTICEHDTLVISETSHFYTEAGLYKDTTLNEWGCLHFIYTHLEVIPPTVPTIWAEDPMCQSEMAFDLYYTYTSHRPIAYSLYFDSIGQSMGFEDMTDVPVTSYTDPMVISVPIPYRGDDPTQYPRPNNYTVRLVLDNGICQHKETDCFHDSTFIMSYPKWITEQRFGDVIALLNEQKNGGYVWSAYQWYQGDNKLEGETKPYLYVPTGLQVGEQYHVQLIREGDTEEFPTCPITITLDPIVNNYAPTMGYLSVVPTCIVTSHPYAYILSRKSGTYRISSSEGIFVSEGSFQEDATQIEVPSTAGLYIVQLWSYDTPEEPYRAIKIVVSDKCENCGTSF